MWRASKPLESVSALHLCKRALVSDACWCSASPARTVHVGVLDWGGAALDLTPLALCLASRGGWIHSPGLLIWQGLLQGLRQVGQVGELNEARGLCRELVQGHRPCRACRLLSCPALTFQAFTDISGFREGFAWQVGRTSSFRFRLEISRYSQDEDEDYGWYDAEEKRGNGFI